jgi:hypothetical protein
MHKNNFYISFGVWLVILPFLGIPGTWRNTLVFLSGFFLILVSLGPAILKKLQTKSKPKKKSELPKEELRFSDISSPPQGDEATIKNE